MLQTWCKGDYGWANLNNNEPKQKLFRDIKSGTSEADGMGLNLGSLSGVHKIRFQSLSSYLSMLRVQVL